VILFVGYQAQGTLGRILVEGVPVVKLFGARVRVRAQIESIRGLSAHADREELLRWVGKISRPRGVFMTHGEEEASLALAPLVRKQMRCHVSVPTLGSSINLLDMAQLAKWDNYALADSAVMEQAAAG